MMMIMPFIANDTRDTVTCGTNMLLRLLLVQTVNSNVSGEQRKQIFPTTRKNIVFSIQVNGSLDGFAKNY